MANNHKLISRRRSALAVCLALGLGFVLALSALAQDPEDPSVPDGGGGYAYIRLIDGAATLIPAGGPGQEGGGNAGGAAVVNQPVLPGDRVLVANRGRVEIVLSDRNLLRLDGGSEVAFDHLAGSPTGDDQGAADRSTQITLTQGNAQLVVVEDALGDELPRIDTPNASLYIRNPGTYRITT
ncbi:MAG TPA: FecR domain-containing protein, partial [Thermoanaerobaculia bacterium]|nr:FecR domain-containing protein [Thermoanaerobaculia bacterium]